MKRSLLCLIAIFFVATGCSQVNMGSSSAKTAATGSAGGATAANVNANLER